MTDACLVDPDLVGELYDGASFIATGGVLSRVKFFAHFSPVWV